jgi:bestrophin-3
MHSVALYVTGNDEYGRMVRRTLMRYLNLTLILVLRSISSAVKRRFPTLEHLVEAGTVFRQMDIHPIFNSIKLYSCLIISTTGKVTSQIKSCTSHREVRH